MWTHLWNCDIVDETILFHLHAIRIAYKMGLGCDSQSVGRLVEMQNRFPIAQPISSFFY